MSEAIAVKKVEIPNGYSLVWSGEYESMQRAQARLMIVGPLTLLLIILIIYLNTRSAVKTGHCPGGGALLSGRRLLGALSLGL